MGWYESVDAAVDSGGPASNPIAASSSFFAVPSSAGSGSTVAVVPLSNTGKTFAKRTPAGKVPLLTAHSAPVTALTFSRFNDHRLATGSRDGAVNVYTIPDGGLEADIGSATVSLSTDGGPSGAVSQLKYHPHADGVLAVGYAGVVRVWDEAAGSVVSSFDGFGAASTRVQGVDWSADGRQVLLTSSDKRLRIFDARTGEVAGETEAHPGSRPARVVSLGSESAHHIATAGFASGNARHVCLWDVRALDTSVQKLSLGQSTGAMVPMFDQDLKVLYVAGRGDTAVRYLEFADGALHLLGSAAGPEPLKGACLVPKPALDVMGCEVARILRLTSRGIVPLRMEVPRKDKSTFDSVSDIFPLTAGSTPGSSAADWAAGDDSAAATMSMDPSAGNLKPISKPPAAPKPDLHVRRTSTASTGSSLNITWGHTPKSGPSPTGRFTPTGKTTPGGSSTPGSDGGAGAGSGAATATTTATTTTTGSGAGAGAGSGPATNSSEYAAEDERRKAKTASLAATLASSPYKYVRGDVPPQNKSFFGMSPDTSELAAFASSTTRFAVAMRGGGGPVLVWSYSAVGKLPATPPVLAGHKSSVSAVAFLPTNPENVLLTGGTDAVVNAWTLNDDNTAAGDPVAFTGHTHPITDLACHPSVNGLFASASVDNSVRLFDVESGSERQALVDLHPEAPVSLEWSDAGSQLLTVARDCKVRVLDPRADGGAGTVVSTFEPHAGGRPPLATFLGASPFILTSGSTRTRKREFKIWDCRKLEDPVQHHELDVGAAQYVPLYDADSGLLTLFARGETSFRTFDLGATWDPEVADTYTPQVLTCATIRTGSPHSGAVLVPKRAMNVANVELARVLRLTVSSVEPIPMIIPRSAALKEFFQDDIFVPAYSGTASMEPDEWYGGSDVVSSIHRSSLKPDSMTLLSEKPEEARKPSKSAQYLAEVRASAKASEHRASLVDQLTSAAADYGSDTASDLSGWSSDDEE